MLCKICNTENQPGATFCENCGATFELEAQVTESFSEEISCPDADPGKKLGLISMILGIVACVGMIAPCLTTMCIFIPFANFIVPFISIFLFIITLGSVVGGFVTGLIALKKSKAAGCKNTMAIVGIILSIVIFVIMIISIIMTTLTLGFAGLVAIITSITDAGY